MKKNTECSYPRGLFSNQSFLPPSAQTSPSRRPIQLPFSFPSKKEKKLPFHPKIIRTCPLPPEKVPPSSLQISIPSFLFFLSFPLFLRFQSSSASQPYPVPSAAQKLCLPYSLRAPKHSSPIMSSPRENKN